MKKSLIVAAALSALTISSSASALDTNQDRELFVQAFGGSLTRSLGRLSFVALGVQDGFCQYLAAWESPYNPNDVNLCILDELRTGFSPSCIVNEHHDITTTLTAGAGSHSNWCEGFNLKGESVQDVTLILGEGPFGIQGIVIQNGYMPTVYPVTSVPC